MKITSNNINLICFHYAGGNKYSYSNFKSFLPGFMKLIPVELPGRGERINEKFITDLNVIIEDQFNQVKEFIDKPYIIFGHSMGALIGYMVVKKIMYFRLLSPKCLVVSGFEGPSVRSMNQKIRSNMSNKELLKELSLLGGIPEEVLNDRSFFDYYEPIIRSDFKAIESFIYTQSFPLCVPIHAMYGSEEEFSFEDVSLWQKETTYELGITEFPGHHFFIFDNVRDIIGVLTQLANRTAFPKKS